MGGISENYEKQVQEEVQEKQKQEQQVKKNAGGRKQSEADEKGDKAKKLANGKEKIVEPKSEAKEPAEQTEGESEPEKPNEQPKSEIPESQTGASQEPKAKEEKKEESKEAKPKKKKVVVPPKGFDLNNLENLWQENGKIDKNKKENVMYAPITLEPKVPIGVETRLKLTEEINFSMTNFDKVNKGLNNSSINCYMNTCLQSLIACPAFFNMLTAVSEAEKDTYEALTHSREIF